MTEDDAKAWIDTRFGSTSLDALTLFVDLVTRESSRQNLISKASMQSIWVRHIVDSAQLVTMASEDGLWIDIGTGAGFPGLVTGLLSDRRTLLVEPRRRRVEFLREAMDLLGIGTRVGVVQSRIETLEHTAAIVSARAVASVDAVLASAAHCTTLDTKWLLPKGRNAPEEVALANKAWHGVFHVERSITDPESMIVVASGVSRR